jgi:hypothetical protein
MGSDWPLWLFRVLYFLLVTLILRLFRRLAPSKWRLAGWRYDNQQIPEPLPAGAIGGAMWALGIGLALTFLLLRAGNQYWASLDGPAVLAVYATQWLWCFMPLVGALGIPWPVTIWWLRHVGRKDEADGIADAADMSGGIDSILAMKRLNIGVVVPIAFFTMLAIPIHLAIGASDVRVGHYGAWHSERFSFNCGSDASRR